MIVVHPDELATLRECGRRLAGILAELAALSRPGLPTSELDLLAERRIAEAGGNPVFKGYRVEKVGRPFPASLCVSINDELVHGIPRPDRLLRSGDIVGLDIGMRYPGAGGLITDTAVTVGVGAVTPQAAKLLEVTRSSLDVAVATLRPGIRTGDLGQAIQRHIESGGFAVVRDLVGHGVGRALHEDPYVPNYGERGGGIVIREGMVLAIEPMASALGAAVVLDPDGWTWRTKDGSLAAHFEHTVVVTGEGAEILTKVG